MASEKRRTLQRRIMAAAISAMLASTVLFFAGPAPGSDSRRQALPVYDPERGHALERVWRERSQEDWYEQGYDDYEESPYGYYEEESFYDDFDFEYWQQDSGQGDDWYERRLQGYREGRYDGRRQR